MVGKQNSTILTVSYGTFSCTLEGFEDSFSTMKAIAEYFRDLAADDRYFGAEPPTPDADMLAKIAEQEVSRRVEAVSKDGAVTLRPYQIEEAEAVADTAPEPEVAEVVQAEPEPAPPPAPEPVATPAPATAYVEETDAFFDDGETHGAMLDEESVAARLKRIREAALANAVDATEADDDAETPDVAEETSDKAEDIDLEALIEETEELLPEDILEEEATPEPEDEVAEDEAELIEEIAEFDESSEEASDEDLADLLALDGADEETLLEDEPDEQPETSSDEEFEALLDAIEDEEFEEDAEPVAEDEAEPVQARILHVKGAALQELESTSEDDLLGFDDDAYEAPENEVDVESLNAIFDEPEQPAAPSSLSDEDEADLMRELAEVEADETDDDEDSEWGDLLDADTEAVVADEEHLFTDSPEEALASAQDLSSLLTDREADEEVNRLMAETETQLSEPEHTRRKTTMQHLKAAFFAKKADGEPEDEDSNDSVAYKEDFEMAVKPKRPVLDGGRKTQRLQSPEAAPLKLVAEQRIVPDEKRSEPAARPTLVKPVRPRRIRAGSAALAEEIDTDAVATPEVPSEPVEKVDFETFVAQMGVDKLPELLEAAASYMTFVEELEKFSRPQIMVLVREALGDAYTREDGLRAFGQLLREGKLVRLEGGRFTVSDRIGFQPS